MAQSTRIYGLDSFRFFAFINVFVFHTGHGYKIGFLGIELFFVLSSFLLTYLALMEIHTTGRFSRSDFFIRRALRIYPLYYLLLLFAFFVLPRLGKALGLAIPLPDEPIYYWLFLSNYQPGDPIYALKFLWSIAVEEQFYLVFILLSYFFKDHFYIPVIFLFAAYFPGLYLIDRFDWYYHANPIAYLPNFGAGMLAARLYFDKKMLTKTKWLVVAMIICFGLCFICYKVDGMFVFFNLPFSFFSAASILFVTRYFHKASRRNLLTELTEHLGKYTYGLYMYSGYVIALAVNVLLLRPSLPTFVLELAILIFVAYSSYHLFEKHFLRLKLRFRNIPVNPRGSLAQSPNRFRWKTKTVEP